MIDIVKYIRQLLPSAFNKNAIMQAYLRVILSPIDYISALFSSFKNSTSYKLSKNAQICYLESLLNDALDNTERRIFITDANSIDMLIAYEHPDAERRIIVSDSSQFSDYTVITYPNFVIGDNLHIFIVNVPFECVSKEPQLRALTNLYKFAGKQYFIVYF